MTSFPSTALHHSVSSRTTTTTMQPVSSPTEGGAEQRWLGHLDGSFSKFFGPGVRLGWIEARPKIIDRLRKSGVLASGGSPNHLTSCLWTYMMAKGLQDEMLNTVKAQYARRCKALCAALRKHIPDADFVEPAGGYFVWVRLPPGCDLTALVDACNNKLPENRRVSVHCTARLSHRDHVSRSNYR
mmetsp:Transcript_60922/g.143934  ORF Transcript_60922/g.143934 Transcript_60922/m.143934 type:complete len:185 (+) Transcript_60922:314-868(+)